MKKIALLATIILFCVNESSIAMHKKNSLSPSGTPEQKIPSGSPDAPKTRRLTGPEQQAKICRQKQLLAERVAAEKPGVVERK